MGKRLITFKNFLKQSKRGQKALACSLAGVLLTAPVIGMSGMSSFTEEPVSSSFSEASLFFAESSQDSSVFSSEVSSSLDSEVSSLAESSEVSSESSAESSETKNDYKNIEIKSETTVAGKDSTIAKEEDAMYDKNQAGGGAAGGVVNDPIIPPDTSETPSSSLPPSSSSQGGNSEAPKPPEESVEKTMIRGIDVSYYQTITDWNKVKASGVEFVIIRVGYRGYGESGTLVLDNQFEKNIQGAKAAGLKVGAYFFSQALNEEEAREEAAFMLKYLSKYSLDYPVAYDMENFNPEFRTYKLWGNKTQITKNAVAFCEVVKEAGYTPMVYYGSGNLVNFDTDLLSSRYKIWFARYPNYTPVDEIPDKMKLNYDGHYDMWQFASDGKVPGITGNVDLNVYYTNKVVQRYFVTYNANGGTNAPVDTTAYEKGSSILLKGQENMKREGYSFTGWNTKADGRGTSYAAGSTYPNVRGSVVLYAQWKKQASLTVTYNANGGKDAPKDSTVYYAGETAKVLEAGALSREGFAFTGWNTKADGSGDSYQPGDSIPNLKASVTLYAQWKKDTSESSMLEAFSKMKY